MSIPNHILEQLNSQADLVGIIGKHTTLKKAGNEFKGCCPFHGEKTPSFYVNPQKNIYHCFGCGVGGNAISFLRDYENLTFKEAVDELSRQTGISVPKEQQHNLRYTRNPLPQTSIATMPARTGNLNSSHIHDANTADGLSNEQQLSCPPYPPYDDQQAVTDSDITNALYHNTGYVSDHVMDSHVVEDYMNGYDDSVLQPVTTVSPMTSPATKQEGNLYDLLTQVQGYYQRMLHSHPHAYDYLRQRGLTDASIATFALGYAPAGWQHLEAEFGQDIAGLKLLGLVRTADSGRDYDLLRDRVIFPIRDNQGQVIGFAGRAMDNEVKPKYINSSDSPVFHKQHVLYGYYESRQQRANDWLVVEGYMDVIALYQAGIYGAVASMGTAINQAQIARLLNFNPTLTLCFDGDAAGQKAAWRTLEVSLPVLSDDKQLQFLTLPDQHDPDSFVKAQGSQAATAMQQQLQAAVPLSQYVYGYLSQQHDLSLAEGKARLMSQVKSLTSQLPKGSSFRYLLNNDIYQKLGGRQTQQRAAHDALLDFSSQLTLSHHLYLCLLYQPSLLQAEPIRRIWQHSGVAQLNIPDGLKQRIEDAGDRLPALPHWQDLGDSHLTELVQAIEHLNKHLPEDTNAASHFIMANLSPPLRQFLIVHWQRFYRQMIARNILDLEYLFEELLIQRLSYALQIQQQHSKSLLVQEMIKRRRQTLMAYAKQKDAEQAAKL